MHIFCVFLRQTKLEKQRQHAKQVALYNLQMSEKKERDCPLYNVSGHKTYIWKVQCVFITEKKKNLNIRLSQNLTSNILRGQILVV